MKNLKIISLLILMGVFIISCENESIESTENVKMNDTNEILGPSGENSILGNNIEAVRNSENKVIGYFYPNDPNNIIEINYKNAKGQSVFAKTTNIVNLVGDEDNFGYGGEANPPCAFYDFSDPIDDLGIFDRELIGSGDDVESWTHDFTGHPMYCSSFEATMVTVEIREKFSDSGPVSTVTIDGLELDFKVNGFSLCGDAIVQTFTFVGAAASFANDGLIDITFKENGDDIALDWSKVTVEGTCDTDGDGCLDDDDEIINSNMETTVNIDGCDYGITNKMTFGVPCGIMMSDMIDALESGTYKNHGLFMKAMAKMLEGWYLEGLITLGEKDLIMMCAGESSHGHR